MIGLQASSFKLVFFFFFKTTARGNVAPCNRVGVGSLNYTSGDGSFVRPWHTTGKSKAGDALEAGVCSVSSGEP